MPVTDWKSARFVATKPFKYGLDDHLYQVGEFIEPGGFKVDRIMFGDDSRWVMVAPDPAIREHWPCDRCGRSFLREDQLRAHQRTLYHEEQHDPERVATLREQATTRKRRELAGETMADLAREQGREVEEVRSGPNGSRVPVIRAG